MLAPICLFVYNRPEHTLRTLEALWNNRLSNESVLFIFSDGPKSNASSEERIKIDQVRKVIRQEKWCKTVKIYESELNKGLADSIINGVSKILSQYEKIIVLEDDLITTEGFLSYMNEALEKYKDQPVVKQISGFSFPVPNIPMKNSCYFLPFTSTWSWATWKRVWNEIDFECKEYNAKNLNNFEFNFYNSYNYSKLLENQLRGHKVSSWGIRFYFNVFRMKGLVLFPDVTQVKNIGWDNSGRHGAKYQLYSNNNWISDYQISIFPPPVLDNSYINIVAKFLRKENSIISKLLKRTAQLLQ